MRGEVGSAGAAGDAGAAGQRARWVCASWGSEARKCSMHSSSHRSMRNTAQRTARKAAPTTGQGTSEVGSGRRQCGAGPGSWVLRKVTMRSAWHSTRITSTRFSTTAAWKVLRRVTKGLTSQRKNSPKPAGQCGGSGRGRGWGRGRGGWAAEMCVWRCQHQLFIAQAEPVGVWLPWLQRHSQCSQPASQPARHPSLRTASTPPPYTSPSETASTFR